MRRLFIILHPSGIYLNVSLRHRGPKACAHEILNLVLSVLPIDMHTRQFLKLHPLIHVGPAGSRYPRFLKRD